MNKVLGIIGFAAFGLGLILAVIFGIVAPANYWIILVLVILGIIIGALNITSKEIMPLLLATIALIVIGGVFEPIKVVGIGTMVDNILKLIATLMAPAAVIAAVKTLWNVGFPEKPKK
jgi:hypothetical protein